MFNTIFYLLFVAIWCQLFPLLLHCCYLLIIMIKNENLLRVWRVVGWWWGHSGYGRQDLYICWNGGKLSHYIYNYTFISFGLFLATLWFLWSKVFSHSHFQIDRASAGNVRRSKDEIDADPEKENQFGYTMSEYQSIIIKRANEMCKKFHIRSNSKWKKKENMMEIFMAVN